MCVRTVALPTELPNSIATERVGFEPTTDCFDITHT